MAAAATARGGAAASFNVIALPTPSPVCAEQWLQIFQANALGTFYFGDHLRSLSVILLRSYYRAIAISYLWVSLLVRTLMRGLALLSWLFFLSPTQILITLFQF